MLENIVEFYFRQCGYRVISFGYEFAMQTVRQIQLEREEEKLLYEEMRRNTFEESELMEKLYSAPDFLVFGRDGKFTLVEVKFRMNPHRMAPREVRGIRKYWPGTKLFLVTGKPASILSASLYPFGENDSDRKFGERELAFEDKELNLDKETYDICIQMIKKYLCHEGVLDNSVI